MATLHQRQSGAIDTLVQAEVVNADCHASRLEMTRLSCGGRRHGGRIHWFVLVGCAAAATHLGIVELLVRAGGVPPLLANIVAWGVALGVSFAGHHRLSFSGHHVPVRAAALRFFAISAAGFLLNELTYAALLRWSGLRFDVGLALVLAGVAVATYWASRHWAFQRNPAP